MDFPTLLGTVGPIGTVLAAGGYVFRLESQLKVHNQMLKDRDARLERIEDKLDRVVELVVDDRNRKVRHGQLDQFRH